MKRAIVTATLAAGLFAGCSSPPTYDGADVNVIIARILPEEPIVIRSQNLRYAIPVDHSKISEGALLGTVVQFRLVGIKPDQVLIRDSKKPCYEIRIKAFQRVQGPITDLASIE